MKILTDRDARTLGQVIDWWRRNGVQLIRTPVKQPRMMSGNKFDILTAQAPAEGVTACTPELRPGKTQCELMEPATDPAPNIIVGQMVLTGEMVEVLNYHQEDAAAGGNGVFRVEKRDDGTYRVHDWNCEPVGDRGDVLDSPDKQNLPTGP